MSEELAVQPPALNPGPPIHAPLLPAWRARARTFLARHALTLGELFLILAGAAIITRPYLNFDPAFVPAGIEYLYHISPNHVWTHAQACGLCALWNGNIGGGYPAFADLQASVLHPYVILATLLFGVVNGAKVVLFLSFATAGFAQWWLGRSLGVSSPARIWTALIAVFGGHLAGRMEGGLYGLVVSLAACSLAFAALVALIQSGTRRSAVLFGVTFAMALLAGQGYVQVGFVFLLPLALLLIVRTPLPAALLGRRLLLGFILAGLLAAPLLLPALHFLPQFSKNTDPQFAAGQPLRFIVLNLLVNDPVYFRTEILGKMSFPAVYACFIGWIPFILSFWGIASRRVTGSIRHGVFLAASALGALWLASSAPLAWVARTVPIPAFQNFIYGVRFTPFLTGLVVAPLLGLAGIGLTRLLAAPWPPIRLQVGGPGEGATSTLELDLRWLLLIPLVWALREAYTFNRQYVYVTRQGDEVGAMLDTLKTPDLQWVNTPFGEWFWIEGALARNLKISLSTRPWSWKDHDLPGAVAELSRDNTPPPGMTLAGESNNIYRYVAGPGREYAAVTGSDGNRTICRATGTGGDIDIRCDAPATGSLTVLENYWPGWQAWVDGQRAALAGNPFITLPLPPGAHTITLRYRPFDALAGLALSLLGAFWAIYLWFRKASPLRLPLEST